MPKLVGFLLAHGATGFGIATLFMLGFRALDPGGGASLLLTAAGHWWPAALLWFFLGLTFGSVQIGVATMPLERQRGP